MKFLIDTNIFIPLEPVSPGEIEASTGAVTELVRLISEAGHQIYVHPFCTSDIQRDTNDQRRKVRTILFQKYPKLPDPPKISSRLEKALGHVEPYTNDWVDNHLIAALQADATDFLVTEDREIHTKVSRLSLDTRVATVAEATLIVKDLFDINPPPPPAVKPIKAHSLDDSDPIFNSFRRDYPNFNEWLRKCKRKHRQAWIIKGDDKHLAAICIITGKKYPNFGLKGLRLKICSFKVSEKHPGLRLGELLLKTIFDYARRNRYEWIYVTVLEKYSHLISLLKDFGFQDVGARTKVNEIVMVKPMSYKDAELDSMDPLPFNMKYGPYAVKFKNVQTFVIPIKPRYHYLLFPEAEEQLPLIPDLRPFGNSIRKAYLSNASIRTIRPGANILFYRSEDWHSITSLGVVEDTLVSSSATEVARYVGKRTVYTFAKIQRLCQKEVLAILFRQCRILGKPIHLDELRENRVLRIPPQSIVTIPREAVEWLWSRINP